LPVDHLVLEKRDDAVAQIDRLGELLAFHPAINGGLVDADHLGDGGHAEHRAQGDDLVVHVLFSMCFGP